MGIILQRDIYECSGITVRMRVCLLEQLK